MPPGKPITVRVKRGEGGGKAKLNTKKKGSFIRTIIEFIFFVVLLLFTGIVGYFVGNKPFSIECPPPPPPETIIKKKTVDCVHEKLGSGVGIGAIQKSDGYTIEELTTMWRCSHAEANFTQANKRIYPKEKNLDKTKWKSILSVDPKQFFDKYLTQYPGDTRAVQPVVVFSHKPLDKFKDIPEVCKVLDVAVVPDTPGVCVAVTETYHDVASYHMLHADRQPDGTFALTANSVEGRVIPDENAYATARALLLSYFNNVDYVAKLVKSIPKFGGTKVAVGCLIETPDELNLFQNSLQSGYKMGISKNKFVAFTTSSVVNTGLKNSGIKLIYLPDLATVGTIDQAKVSETIRTYFLQAWLAFACANNQVKVMWQSPGTIWMDRPDNIVNIAPIVETLWSYKGRDDKRAAPFFASYDFFAPTGAERPIHLMHEILLHFDLVLAWGSLDAVASYRLSENNARYGTTTYMLPPFRVLHTALMKNDPEKIKGALVAKEKPMAIVIPREGLTSSEAIKILKDSNLWFLKS